MITLGFRRGRLDGPTNVNATVVGARMLRRPPPHRDEGWRAPFRCARHRARGPPQTTGGVATPPPKKRGVGWGPYGGRMSILVRRLSYLRWLGNSPDPAESPTISVAAPRNCRINVPSCDRPSRARTARCWWGEAKILMAFGWRKKPIKSWGSLSAGCPAPNTNEEYQCLAGPSSAAANPALGQANVVFRQVGSWGS